MILLGLLFSSIFIYFILGYQVILIPGRLYNTLVTLDWLQFQVEICFCSIILLLITSIRVLRGYLTDALANIVRSKLALQFHLLYLNSSDSLLVVTHSDGIDNLDQRLVADTRDLCDSLLAIVAGRPSEASAGAIEAFLSIIWYSVVLAERAGMRVLFLAYTWSAVACVLSSATISFAAKTRADAEASEAHLRYSHGSLRTDASAVAFEGTHHWHRNFLDSCLSTAVSAKWHVIRANLPLAMVNHGFAYFVTLVMYGSLALSISADDSFLRLSSGEKAQWISQTGGVFLQLLYAFTMVISLSSTFSSLAAQTHRVHEVLVSLQRQSSPVESAVTENSSNRIEFSELQVSIPDGRVTAPISTRIEVGQRVLITGSSGVGKTRTLFCLRGLIQPYSGSIVSMPSNVMFVAQKSRLALGICSLRECIISPYPVLRTNDESIRLQLALKDVGWVRADSLDDECDWDTVLSPGERQQILMAKVIVNNPCFAVMDEPTSALDLSNERKCFQALSELGIGLLTVSHSKQLELFHNSVILMKEPMCKN